MTLLPSLHKARDKAGANTAKGRHYTVIEQAIRIQPVDERHAERIRGILLQAERGLRALVAADRGTHPSDLSGAA